MLCLSKGVATGVAVLRAFGLVAAADEVVAANTHPPVDLWREIAEVDREGARAALRAARAEVPAGVSLVKKLTPAAPPPSFTGAVPVAVWADPRAFAVAARTADRALLAARRSLAHASDRHLLEWQRAGRKEVAARQAAADLLAAIEAAQKACVPPTVLLADPAMMERWGDGRSWSSRTWAARRVAAATREFNQKEDAAASSFNIALRTEAAFEAALRAEEKAAREAALPLPTWNVGRTGRQGVLAATINLPAKLAAEARAVGAWRPNAAALFNVRLTRGSNNPR